MGGSTSRWLACSSVSMDWPSFRRLPSLSPECRVRPQPANKLLCGQQPIHCLSITYDHKTVRACCTCMTCSGRADGQWLGPAYGRAGPPVQTGHLTGDGVTASKVLLALPAGWAATCNHCLMLGSLTAAGRWGPSAWQPLSYGGLACCCRQVASAWQPLSHGGLAYCCRQVGPICMATTVLWWAR